MRQALLTTAILCAAVTAAAQSHEPAAKGGAKPAPLVSRITAAPKPTPKAAAEHGEADAPGAAAPTGKPKPLVSGSGRVPSVSTPAAAEHAPAPASAAATGVHASASAHSEVKPAPAAAAKTPAGKGPVNLATVHGRLTAALAGLHEEPARGRRSVPAPPRYTVTWPVARWRVAWRDDSDRVVVSWPE